MPKRESTTQFAARHARYQQAKDLLDHIGSTGEKPQVVLDRIKAMLNRIVERDGRGF